MSRHTALESRIATEKDLIVGTVLWRAEPPDVYATTIIGRTHNHVTFSSCHVSGGKSCRIVWTRSVWSKAVGAGLLWTALPVTETDTACSHCCGSHFINTPGRGWVRCWHKRSGNEKLKSA